MRRALSAVIFIGFAIGVPDARGDVPPDPDSADAHCSLVEQCPTGGAFCAYTFRPGQESSPEQVAAREAQTKCESALEAKGLQRRCRAGGNYSGQNLFCPAGATGSWKPRSAIPKSDSGEKRGCLP
jgi:hypothetical protein